jgi:hypothetical protein
MAKKKILKKTIPIPSLNDDMKDIKLPFELLTGFSVVVNEVQEQGFKYDNTFTDSTSTLTFISKELKQRITINISKENLLIKQFSDKEDDRELKVIYVVKDSGRNFKLIL